MTHANETNRTKTDLLPLGSIVLLKDGEKKLMIYGRGQLSATTGQGY